MSILQKISKASVYLLIFFTPLFFSPLTQNVLDFQKQTFFLIIALIGLMAWIGDSLISKTLAFNSNPAGFFVGAILLGTFISSLFSIYSFGSLWGLPLDVAASFLSLAGFVLFYFLVTNLFSSHETKKLLFTLILSSFFSAVFGLLQLYGLFVFPFDFAKTASFNTVGSVNSLGLFLAVILAAVFTLLVSEKNKLLMGALAFIGAVLFFYLVVINFFAAWIVLALGCLAVFVQSFVDRDSFSRGALVAVSSFALLGISLFFIAVDLLAQDFVRDTYKVFPATPVEVSLTNATSWSITSSTLKSSAKNLLIGSGPGAFVYDYSRFKPESINLTNFWSLKFGAAANEIFSKLATTGILGIVFFAALIGFIAVKGFKMLLGDQEDKELLCACYVSWLAIVATLFLYPFNFTLYMLFWLFTALIVGLNEDYKKTVEFSLGSRAAYAVPLLLVAILVLELVALVWVGKRLFAEAKYLQAMHALERQDFSGSVEDLKAAIGSTGSSQDNYLRDLAQVYLAWVRKELSDNADQKKALETVAPLMGNAVEAAKIATDSVNGNDANNWAVRGYIYRELIGAVKDADSWAITCYKKAIDLEPSSSYLYVDLAQVYIMKEDYEGAKENLLKAIGLNPNYSNARYYLGLIYAKEGKKDEAVKEFEIIYQLNPDNADVAKILEDLRAGNAPIQEQPAVPAPELNAPELQGAVNPALPDGAANPSQSQDLKAKQ